MEVSLSTLALLAAARQQCREQSSPGRPGTWEVLISLVPEGLFWLVFGWFWPVFGQFSLIGGIGGSFGRAPLAFVRRTAGTCKQPGRRTKIGCFFRLFSRGMQKNVHGTYDR